MSKKYFIFAIAACLSLAVITSCSNKPSKTSNDTEESDDADDEESSEPSLNYLTQDLATFDLFGQVASVSYELAGQLPVTIRFDSSGQIASIKRTNTEGIVETAELTYNDQQQLEQIEWPDDPWVVLFSYSRGTMTPTQYSSTNRYGNGATYTYTRDEVDHHVVSIKREESVHFEEVDNSSPTFEFDDIDSHGNWLSYTEHQEGWTYTIHRTITYHGSASASAKSSKITLDAAKEFITDMYENQYYYEDAFLEKHCTKSMLKWLRDMNDYDVECYAGWLFRTSSQDGKPDSDDTPDRVLSVTKQPEGWWRYEFTDGGWRGINELLLIDDDGTIKIDKLRSVYDEHDEYYKTHYAE